MGVGVDVVVDVGVGAVCDVAALNISLLVSSGCRWRACRAAFTCLCGANFCLLFVAWMLVIVPLQLLGFGHFDTDCLCLVSLNEAR